MTLNDFEHSVMTVITGLLNASHVKANYIKLVTAKSKLSAADM